MVFILGGAYQGKLEYAIEKFNLSRDEVYFCDDKDPTMPEGKIAFHEIDKWILALIKSNINVTEAIEIFMETNPDAIVICNDISCGIVPIDTTHRKWREETGRAMGQLARNSNEVVRLFCGIPTTVKST